MLKPDYPFNYKWHHHGNVSVIGWSYLPGSDSNTVLKGEELSHHFSSVASSEDLVRALRLLNGHYAVAIFDDAFTALAVDPIRSFPLLYRQSSQSLELLSYPFKIDWPLDDNRAEAFLESWCTPGNQTLSADIDQLLAGQYIWRKTGDEIATPQYYFNHFVKQKSNLGRKDLVRGGVSLLNRVFLRLVEQLKGRIALVPLSGGYDSRLILAMLHKHGHRDIITYTYGRPNSHEVSIAREVAGKLKIPWHFVEYDETLFKVFFTDEWQAYSAQNHFLTSLPHEQDFFALWSLQQHGRLPESFVALPGFCGDLLGGSITGSKPNRWTNEALIRFIRQKHFGGKDMVTGLWMHADIKDAEQFYDNYQQYFVENKVSKFIVNAVRVYEYFGGEWIMPLWDRELVEFFYALPYAFREEQSLYNEILFDHIFASLDIGIRKPDFDDNYPNAVKARIKAILPEDLVKPIRSIMHKKNVADPVGLQVLNRLIYEHLSSPPKQYPEEINITHAKYFLEKLKN